MQHSWAIITFQLERLARRFFFDSKKGNVPIDPIVVISRVRGSILHLTATYPTTDALGGAIILNL